MKQLINKLKSSFLVFMTMILGLSLVNPAISVFAANEGSVINPDPVTLADGTKLYKTAKPVEGMINQWDITLRIEALKTTKTSDTVLVIDRSGSMAGTKLASAKTAANSLIDRLLIAGNTTNRIAVMSFATDTTINQSFTTSNSAAKNAVNRLGATGATFTQSAMREASGLINSSTADFKNIILLSDGEPTYCYEVNRDWRMNTGNLIPYSGGGWQTPSTIPQNQFNDNRVGTGRSMYELYDDPWGTASDKRYNCGNHAIAEAGFYKTNYPNGLYTIALDAGTVGTPVLNAMASPGKSYTATESELEAIFDEIAGKISSAVQDASVVDGMAVGINATNIISGEGAVITPGGGSLNWNIGTPEYDAALDKYVAELTYRIEGNESLASVTPDENGFRPANDEAVLTYNNGQTGAFPVPKVKASIVNVTKKMVGSVCAECSFVVDLQHESGTTYPVQVQADQVAALASGMKIGDYTVRESHVINGSLMQYDQDIDVNQFTLAQGDDDRMITVTNILKTRSVNVEKKWDGKPGESATVELYANNIATGETATLAADADWRFSFDNLMQIDTNGEEINYSVVENQVDGYEVPVYSGDMASGLIVTNTYKPVQVDVTGHKEWKGGENFNGGIRPDVQLQLHQNGTAYGDPVTLKNGVTSHVWENVPETDIDGNLHKYTVKEVTAPENYKVSYDEDGLTAINTYKSPLTSITGTKKWQFGDSLTRPNITLELWRHTATTESSKVMNSERNLAAVDFLSQGNTWAVEWTGLDATDASGDAYTYTVREVTNLYPTYETTYDQGTWTVTNTYQIPTNSTVEATKVWTGGDSLDRPTVYFKLFRQIGENGTPEAVDAPLEELAAGDTTANWSNLERTDINGDPYIFTVKETDSDGNLLSWSTDFPYDTSYSDSGLTVTNTYVSPKIDTDVSKQWNGGLERPDVTVELLRDGETFSATTLYADNNWQAFWTGLDKTDEQGVEYAYTVVETSKTANYTVSYTGNVTDGFTITNTYVSPKADIYVTKKWVDAFTAHPTVEVQLLQDGVALGGAITLSELNGWVYIWKGMDLTDENGNPYEYTVEEISKPGQYTSVISGTSEEGFLIVNTYVEVGMGGGDPVTVPAPKLASTGINSYLLLLGGVMLIGFGLQLAPVTRRSRS